MQAALVPWGFLTKFAKLSVRCLGKYSYCGIKGKFCAKTLIICKGLATKLTLDTTVFTQARDRDSISTVDRWAAGYYHGRE